MIERLQLVVRLLEHERGGGVVLGGLLCLLRHLLELRKPERDFKAFQRIAQGEVFFGLFCLLAQGLDLQLQLGNFIADTKQVVLGIGKAALGLLLAVAVF